MKSKQIKVDTDCDLARYVAYVDARNVGFTSEEARSMSLSVYFMSMGLDTASISQ